MCLIERAHRCELRLDTFRREDGFFVETNFNHRKLLDGSLVSTNRTERRAFDSVHAHESETMQGCPASCLIYGEQYRFVRDSMGTRVVACAAAREPLRSWKPCQEI
jgi:hypothetical protein